MSPSDAVNGAAFSASRKFAALCSSVQACTACSRVSHTHTLSTANGPLDADALFVAEAPGRLGAALTGVPLSGDESGRRFEQFLALAGLRRDRVFVTNAMLCNPLDSSGRNRPPSRREIADCRGFLERTLTLVRAPLIVALGRVALDALCAIEAHSLSLPIGAVSARPWQNRRLVALYHPSRQSTLHRSQQLQEADWRALTILLAQTPTASRRLSPVTPHL